MISTGSPNTSQESIPNRKRRSKAKSKTKRETQLHDAVPRLITTRELRSLNEGTKDVNALRIHNATPTLPPSFFKLFRNLRNLDLRRIGLRILPPQILMLENLQKLDLRYNNLTYLPSQIAQLPNLQQLQIDDVRDRKTRMIKEVDGAVGDVEAPMAQDLCECGIRCNGQKITPPLPTLTQLCARKILSAIPDTASDDPDVLSWEDLELFYSTGIYEGNTSNINDILPFPSHLLPRYPSLDICSLCNEIVLPVHAQFERVQIVALCRVRLRFVFCSHECFCKVIEKWKAEQEEEMKRKTLREARFHIKYHDAHGGP